MKTTLMKKALLAVLFLFVFAGVTSVAQASSISVIDPDDDYCVEKYYELPMLTVLELDSYFYNVTYDFGTGLQSVKTLKNKEFIVSTVYVPAPVYNIMPVEIETFAVNLDDLVTIPFFMATGTPVSEGGAGLVGLPAGSTLTAQMEDGFGIWHDAQIDSFFDVFTELPSSGPNGETYTWNLSQFNPTPVLDDEYILCEVTMTVGEFTGVPIPGAVWLLGSGLVGLVGIRRKFQKA